MPAFASLQPVKIKLLDAERPGVILGSARNSLGELVYLVEIKGGPDAIGRKRPVLSLYRDELEEVGLGIGGGG